MTVIIMMIKKFFSSKKEVQEASYGGLLVGLMFFLLALIWLLIIGVFQLALDKTEGTIINYEQYRNDKGTLMHKPVFKYFNKQGVELIKSAMSSSNRKSYEIGQKVEVMYKNDNPKITMINDFSNLFMPPIVMLIASVFSLGFYRVFKKPKSVEVASI